RRMENFASVSVCSCSDHFPVSGLVYLLAGGALAHFLISPPFPSGISSKLPRDRGSFIPTWPGGVAPRPGFGGGSLLHPQTQSENITATSPRRVDSQNRGMITTPELSARFSMSTDNRSPTTSTLG